MEDITVIVTAGGIGKRMGGDLPKQFMLLNELPILYHTLHFFHQQKEVKQLILTLPDDWQPYWKSLFHTFPEEITHTIVSGGKERFHSIQNALKISSNKWVAIHDGVRPFVNKSTWKNCLNAMKNHHAVIPVTNLKESIRQIFDLESKSVPRDSFKLVQTPQFFELKIIQTAYQQEFTTEFTDDASVVEKLGQKITLVEGNEENIKITTPFDLIIAKSLIQNQHK